MTEMAWLNSCAGRYKTWQEYRKNYIKIFMTSDTADVTTTTARRNANKSRIITTTKLKDDRIPVSYFNQKMMLWKSTNIKPGKFKRLPKAGPQDWWKGQASPTPKKGTRMLKLSHNWYYLTCQQSTLTSKPGFKFICEPWTSRCSSDLWCQRKTRVYRHDSRIIENGKVPEKHSFFVYWLHKVLGFVVDHNNCSNLKEMVISDYSLASRRNSVWQVI